jgi:DNA-binding Lrp family transcriptional regulator
LIHKDLCNPIYTKNWTALRIHFNLLLASIHTWNGEIPLTLHEIAERLNCHVDSVKRCVAEAEYDGVIQRQGNKIIFCKVVKEKESYVRHLAFLYSEEFRAEDVQVIRFVLFGLFFGVYSPDMAINRNVRELYHQFDKQKNLIKEGLFNIYHAVKMREVIKKAQKYLVITGSPLHVVRIIGIQAAYAKGKVINEGEFLSVKRVFERYGLQDANKEVMEEIVKIKSRYKDLQVAIAYEIVDEALRRSFQQENGPFVSLILQNDVRRVGAYFSAVCREVEQEYASRLQRRKEQLDKSQQINRAYKSVKNHPLQTVKDCMNLFKKQLDRSLQAIKEEVAAFDQYLVNAVAKLMKKQPGKEESFVLERVHHPLVKQLPLFQKIIKEVEETIRSRQELQSRPFPFYNWLEDK